MEYVVLRDKPEIAVSFRQYPESAWSLNNLMQLVSQRNTQSWLESMKQDHPDGQKGHAN